MKKINNMLAQNAYCQGKTIIMCPSKCSPESMFAGRFTSEEKLFEDRKKEFKRLVNEFLYYNCTLEETGLQIHYYLED